MSVNIGMSQTREESSMNPNDVQTGQPGVGVASRRKSPALAGLLSLLPGLGQVYIGYYRRGFVHLLIIAAVITLLDSRGIRSLEPLLGLFLAFFWLYSIIDAVRLAGLYNDAMAGYGPEDLTRELAKVGKRGTVGGGAALLVVGFLFLLHTLFGVSMEWIKYWWPVLPIGFGAYLLIQGFRDRNSDRGV